MHNACTTHTPLIVIVLGIACAAPTDDLGSATRTERGKADVDFDPAEPVEVDFAPVPIELDGPEVTTELGAHGFARFALDVERATALALELQWDPDACSRTDDTVGMFTERHTQLSFARYEEPESGADPVLVFDGVTEPITDRRMSFRYFLVDAGAYVIEAHVSPEAYDAGQTLSLRVETASSEPTFEPGDVKIHFLTDLGVSPRAMRVRMGPVETETDCLGDAFLFGVPAGPHVVEVGPELQGRPIGGDATGDEPIAVTSGGRHQLVLFVEDRLL